MVGPNNLFFITLAGGSGSRLWPLSRPDGPKHLQTLVGQGTLLQQTVRRLLEVLPPERILAVTRRSQAPECLRQLNEIVRFPSENLLQEPEARNTLPAICWAALTVSQRQPDSLLGVFPSDHVIVDEGAFQKDMERAVALAEQGFLVTFGVTPSSPETGFGYIRAGSRLGSEAFRAEAFLEKPDAETARGFLSQGGYFWNSGIFFFKASVFLEEVRRFQEPLWQVLNTASGPSEIAGSYGTLPSLSIDIGVMEKSDRVAVIPASFGWNDVGNWDAVYQAMEKNDDGNAIQGLVRAEDTRGSLLMSPRGLLAAIGLKDMVVVRSGEDVLVCPRNRSQDVRKVTENVSAESSATVLRPWGLFTVLEEGSGYKLKRIVVNPGQKLSLQSHRRRAEHWVVIEGVAKVVKADSELTLRKYESTFIPMGEKHRLENPGTGPLVIIEVQTGDYVGEDDIERFDDIYGRTIVR